MTDDWSISLTPDTPTSLPIGNFTFQSRLTFPSDSGCTSDQQKLLWQAFADALSLAEAVGPPELVWANRPGDDIPKGPAPAGYYGKEPDWSSVVVLTVEGTSQVIVIMIPLLMYCREWA